MIRTTIEYHESANALPRADRERLERLIRTAMCVKGRTTAYVWCTPTEDGRQDGYVCLGKPETHD